MENDKILGSVLKYVRIAHEQTIGELAQDLEVSTAYISNIENGKKKPSDNIISKYCENYDLPLNVLLYFDSEAKTHKLKSQQILLMILKYMCKLLYGDKYEWLC